jgi:hypothetical protein
MKQIRNHNEWEAKTRSGIQHLPARSVIQRMPVCR